MTIQYEGGYFLHDEALVRGGGANGHTANDMSQLSDYTVEAVNLIQATPWKINPFILSVACDLQERGMNLTTPGADGRPEVVVRFEQPINPKKDPYHQINERLSEADWLALPPEDKKRLKQRNAKFMKDFEKAMGTYRATKRIINAALEMSQFEKFYFPHNLDFRTRIYPIPTDLNPQSSDLAKGLLRFARGTRLGQEGLYWLGVMAASHEGQDKLSPDERFAYASRPDVIEKWSAWVDEPVDNLGWLGADKPWQFLAAAHEFVWALRQDIPESFISYLPGNLDGSCNGAQHLSIMSRDLRGATATNCRSTEATGGKRYDLYQEVGDAVWEKVQLDLSNGHPLAEEWAPKMENKKERRKIVKRSVMTVPYGVTEYGIADFMMKDGHVSEDADNQWDSAKYMRDLIWSSIGEILTKGKELQEWFSECARICAEAGKPLQWDTPAGSKVTQAYRQIIQRRIHAYSMKFYIYEEPQEGEAWTDFYARLGMDVAKMQSAAPPNVVHSCDASHLQITVCRMAEVGIKDFSMIHDSFGCPMAQVGLMRDILRQTIVDMYEDGYLERFKESVEAYSGLEMPPVPNLGEFDIREILGSEFFFA